MTTSTNHAAPSESERLAHTLAVLQAVRCVHRLLTRERDIDRLLRGTCACLTSPRDGYDTAWIMLQQPDGPLFAQAGLGAAFEPLRAALTRGELPPCAKQALEYGAVFVARDPSSCSCPLAPRYRGQAAIAAPLGFGDQPRGVLCAALPRRLSDGPAKAAFFAELATDVAFALDNLETEERVQRERRRLEEQLRQTEKMEAMGQLASGVAHDFNNQLTGIMGHANLLLRMLDDSPLKEHAEIIIRACRSAADLNQKLLAFGRRGQLRLVTLDMHALIHEVIQLLSRSIDKRITLECELAAPQPLVRGDPSQLQNALLNIALNARDALPEGGHIRFISSEATVAASPDPTLPAGPYLQLRIEDDGVGMDGHTLTHVFEPFFTTKAEGKGTGMGLASVYGTVKRHGGFIELTSVPGSGTAVLLHLPLTEPLSEEEAAPPPRVAPPRAQATHTVLIVDDEDTVRELLRQMLEALGYRVIACAGGRAGIAELSNAEQHIDLVLLDVMMPGLGGPETLRRMRAVDRCIPVLITSGYALQGDAQRMLDEGALAFLPKPFSLDELAERVSAALSAVAD